MILSRFLVNALLLCSLFVPQASPDETKIWQEFVSWLKAQADVTQIGQDRYRAKLIADGLVASDADARMAVIGRLIPQHRDELSPIYFDRLYVTPNQTRFTLEPNAFLVATTKDLRPGKALDVAMGQGRNAGSRRATPGWTSNCASSGCSPASGEARPATGRRASRTCSARQASAGRRPPALRWRAPSPAAPST